MAVSQQLLLTATASEVTSSIKARTAARRAAEKIRRKAGEGQPYDHLNFRDLERYKRSGAFDVLYEEDEKFRARATLITHEIQDAAQTLVQVEADAKMAASLEAPDVLKLIDRQSRERQAYLIRHGIEDVTSEAVADHVKIGFDDLIKTQHEEAERQKVLHGNAPDS